jgi:hypothetical protein
MADGMIIPHSRPKPIFGIMLCVWDAVGRVADGSDGVGVDARDRRYFCLLLARSLAPIDCVSCQSALPTRYLSDTLMPHVEDLNTTFSPGSIIP